MKLPYAIRSWFERIWPWVSKRTAVAQERAAVAREREAFAKYRKEGLAEDRKKLQGLIALLTRVELECQNDSSMLTLRIMFDGRMFHGGHEEDRELLARECGRRVEYELRDIRTLLIETKRKRYAI